MENSEIIQKLEKVEKLLDESYEINCYIEKGCAEEYGEKIKPIIKDVSDISYVPSVFKNFPVFNYCDNNIEALYKEYDSKRKIFKTVLIPTLVCVALYLMLNWDFLSAISSLGLMASLLFGFLFFSAKGKYFSAKADYEKALTESEKSFAEFRKTLKDYEKEKAEGIESTREFFGDYSRSFLQYKKLLREFQEKKYESLQKFADIITEVKSYDFIPPEYYHLVRPVMVLLKSGRAENYKDALNLALEEERQEKIAEERRQEENRRLALLEQQQIAENQRMQELERHNRELEQQQILQNKMMLDEQRKQQRDAQEAERKAKSEAFAEEAYARKQALHRCSKCKKRSACGVHAGIPNCGAFEPW